MSDLYYRDLTFHPKSPFNPEVIRAVLCFDMASFAGAVIHPNISHRGQFTLKIALRDAEPLYLNVPDGHLDSLVHVLEHINKTVAAYRTIH